MNKLLQKYSSKQLFFGGLILPIALGIVAFGAWAISGNFTGGLAEENHIRGNKNAKVKLVEYSDFQCPFCERAYPTLQQVLKDYGDKVSLEYRHYPLSFHPFAQKAAEASECAAEQGKFWEFHDKNFENQTSLSFEALKQWAKDLGLNTKKFNNCLDTDKYAQKVADQTKEGGAKGVNGTPTTFINGQPVVGAQPYEAFKQAIDAELAK